jgi:hypothetical protein
MLFTKIARERGSDIHLGDIVKIHHINGDRDYVGIITSIGNSMSTVTCNQGMPAEYSKEVRNFVVIRWEVEDRI